MALNGSASAVCYLIFQIYKRKNYRTSRALFFLIGLRQAKVVDVILVECTVDSELKLGALNCC